MHRAEYHLACAPDPATILGHRLRPLTLGHAHLMVRVGSPFLGEGEPLLGDVVLGVELCRRETDDARSFIEQENAVRIIEKMGRKWARKLPPGDELQPILEFAAYVSEAAQGPRFWVENKEAQRKSGVDWLQSLKLGLMRAGRSAAEAMATPLGEAMWDYAAYWESEGAIKLHTEDDDALLAAVKRAKEQPAPEGMVAL